MNVRATALTAVCGVAAAFSFTACGGGEKAVDAEDWVADVCDLAIDFQAEGEDILADLDDIDFSARNAKSRIIDVFETFRDEHASLRDEFEKLGYPDVERGKEIRDAFEDNLEEIDEVWEQLIEDVDDLGTRNFDEEVNLLFDEFSPPDLRRALTRVRGDADLIIELVEEDEDCAFVLF